MNFVKDKTLGYMYMYNPSHKLANKSGKVYEHHVVMVAHTGVPLKDNECVHHKDRDRANNDISNLLLMTTEEHAKLHAVEDRGVEYTSQPCPHCGFSFLRTVRTAQTFCSHVCYTLDKRVFEVTKEELNELVWSMPTTKVAKLFGVSDSAIGKRCKKLGVAKPPRGYWQKRNKKLLGN